MRRLLLAGSNRRGFTLVEVMIASTVLALIITSLCGIYFAVAKEWERQDGRGTALAATSMACSKIADYVAQSTNAIAINRQGTGDALAVNLPANTAYGNLYVPTWSSGSVNYQSGQWIVFYLSDATGNFSRNGNILWAATVTLPSTVTPDTAWSLYYDQPKGRISPISSIQFTVSSDSLPRVTITATSSFKTGTTQSRVRLTRTVCVQNAN